MVFQIFWIVLIVFIWFNTTALVDYSKLLKLDGVLKIKDWNVYRLTSNISYLDYLSLKHKGFITKLLSCKPCFMFWIALIISFIFRTPIEQFGMIYILSYSLYKLFDKYVW
jgi:hypothetical protein